MPNILIYITSFYEVTYISQEKYTEKRFYLSREVARLLTLLNSFRENELRSTKIHLIDIKNISKDYEKTHMNYLTNSNQNT